jgi:hypothetical protein
MLTTKYELNHTNTISSGLDTTIAANIQPQIYLSLGELTKLSWIGTGMSDIAPLSSPIYFPSTRIHLSLASVHLI